MFVSLRAHSATLSPHDTDRRGCWMAVCGRSVLKCQITAAARFVPTIEQSEWISYEAERRPVSCMFARPKIDTRHDTTRHNTSRNRQRGTHTIRLLRRQISPRTATHSPCSSYRSPASAVPICRRRRICRTTCQRPPHFASCRCSTFARPPVAWRWWRPPVSANAPSRRQRPQCRPRWRPPPAAQRSPGRIPSAAGPWWWWWWWGCSWRMCAIWFLATAIRSERIGGAGQSSEVVLGGFNWFFGRWGGWLMWRLGWGG